MGAAAIATARRTYPLDVVKLDWKEILYMYKTKCKMKGDQNSIDSVVKSYQKVFSSQDAGIKGFEAKVKIKANVSPVF